MAGHPTGPRPYFNDHEPFACDWLQNLWPGATVDRRSIVDLRGADLSGHGRVHLFAGIGGWEYALQLAGWPDTQSASGLADAGCKRDECGLRPGEAPGATRAPEGETRERERGGNNVGVCGESSWGNTWLPCLDGKARRVEPGIFPLAHGVPGRVGRLRAYGNAIVPQQAAAFVSAFMASVGIAPLGVAA